MGSLWSFPGFGIIISASCQEHGIFPDIQIKLKILRSIFLVKGDVDSLKIGSEFYLVQQLCHGIFFFFFFKWLIVSSFEAVHIAYPRVMLGTGSHQDECSEQKQVLKHYFFLKKKVVL